MHTDAKSRCHNWSHPWFGFFRLNQSANCHVMRVRGLPQVTDFVDETWSYPQQTKLVNHLEQSCEIAMPIHPGDFKCLLCDELLTARLFHWNGSWLWPGSLAHYVVVHRIRLPDRMLRYIEDKDFTI